MMKKYRFGLSVLFSFLMAAVLFLGTGCGAAAAKTSVVGKWIFSSLKSGDEELTAAMLGSMDIVTLEFKADGTVSMNLDGEPTAGKWTEKDGKVTITEDESKKTDEVSLQDADTLIMKNGEDTITLLRDGSEAAKKVAATISAGTADAGSEESMSDAADSAASAGNDAAASSAAGTVSKTDAAAAESKASSSGTESSAAAGNDVTESRYQAFTFTDVTVKNTEIYNKDGVTVTTTGFTIEDYYGPSLNIQIVNNSDHDIAASVAEASVNGYMLYGQLWETVVAGKMANSQIYLPETYLEDAQISTIMEIEFRLVLENPTDYSVLDKSDVITVKTSAYGTGTQTDRSNGTEIYNSDGIRIVSLGYVTDATGNKTILLYAENTSDKYIDISADKASVDNVMTSNISYYADILPGKKAVSGITFYDTLSNPKSFSCVFSIMDNDTYETIAESPQVTISME